MEVDGAEKLDNHDFFGPDENTDATLGGITCGAIQREADEQDRLTQRWSLVSGAGGRRHRDRLARGRNRIGGTTNGRTVASGIRDEPARGRCRGQRGRTHRVDKKQWKEITSGAG
jgi:hypothetical protein